MSIEEILRLILEEYKGRTSPFDFTNLIKQLHNLNRKTDCYRLILLFPYLDVSISILREDGTSSIDYLMSLEQESYFKEKINCAKGITYFLQKDYASAHKELEIALSFPIEGVGRKYIEAAIKTCLLKLENQS